MNILETLEAEQERLRALPHTLVREPYLSEYYGGSIVLEECGSSSGLREKTVDKYNRKTKEFETFTVYECGITGCSIQWKLEQTLEGKNWDDKPCRLAPEHARPMDMRRQAQVKMDLVLDLLGVGADSDAGYKASGAARDSRAETLAGRLADGLPGVLAALLRQDAAVGVGAAVKDLVEFTRDGDDIPFFSEESLYDLVGKGDARSILGRTRDLAAAVGYSEVTG